MTGTFDPDGDLSRIADGLQTVKLIRRPRSTSVEIDGALSSAATTEPLQPSHGKYLGCDIVWHLPTAVLEAASVEPRPGDVIVDAPGRRWTVLAASQATLQSRWRCPARDLAVAHGLDAYVDIERATYSKDEAGAVAASWSTAHTGLAARIQPIDDAPMEHQQRHTTRARYKVYLAEAVELDHACRLRGADGTCYRIDKVTRPERIDLLLEVDASRWEPR
jgi:hypothetical protein